MMTTSPEQAQPNAEGHPQQPEAANEPSTKTVMKRLTIDITDDLHRKIKASCALRGKKIADEVRELLLEKYGKQ